MARIELTSHLSAPPEIVWEHVQTSALLDYIAAPVVRFEPAAGAFPARWSEGDYRARMRAFGLVPIGEQTIGIEYPQSDGKMWVLRDNGHGSLIKRWDHWIFVEPASDGTRYTDRVEIEAGILTPFVVLFARVFYAHRQRRWKKLIAAGFAPLDKA